MKQWIVRPGWVFCPELAGTLATSLTSTAPRVALAPTPSNGGSTNWEADIESRRLCPNEVSKGRQRVLSQIGGGPWRSPAVRSASGITREGACSPDVCELHGARSVPGELQSIDATGPGAELPRRCRCA